MIRQPDPRDQIGAGDERVWLPAPPGVLCTLGVVAALILIVFLKTA